MKKRMLYMLMCVLAPTILITGCQNDSTEETTTIYGEISKIDGDEITIALGEAQEMEKPSDEGQPDNEADGQNASGDTPPEAPTENGADGSAGGQPGGITLTGEEQTITVDDDTEVAKQSGGMNGGPGGEKPDGEAPDGEANAEAEDISPDDLEEGDIVSVELNGDKVESITVQSQGQGMGGDSAGSDTGSTKLSGGYTVDGNAETSDGQSYDSTATNENTVLVENEGTLELTNATLTKAGDSSSADESNFYGLNAVMAVTKNSTATISDSSLTSASEGSNAIFVTGENAKLTATNIKIHTTGNSSRGLDATYGGSITAANVDVTTEGAHCAPVATDRGEGTITLDGGTLVSTGDGSPCIYSTGDITVKNAVGTATGSQAAVVEGKNSISLENCSLTGAGENGIMLYQSTSGDASEGTAEFSAVNSELATTSEGPMFYITNTKAEATLENTVLTFDSGILINAAGNNTNNWGQEGSNGGDFILNGINQELTGDVTCDNISTVTVNLTEESTLEGIVNGDNEGKEVNITLEKASEWKVTGDSYVTALTDEDESCSNIISNGYTIYYDSSADENAWLGGETIQLGDGGCLKPME